MRRFLATALWVILLTASARAELSARWIGVAGLILEDGETTLLFDPIFTRPGLLHWVGLKPLIPDLAAIEDNLKFLGLSKADGIFVSHEHFDHAVDAPWLAHHFKAGLYGGPSLEKIMRANRELYGWPIPKGVGAKNSAEKNLAQSVLFHSVADRADVTVGKFRIHFYRRDHAAIFPAINFHFLAGLVPENFQFGFYDYREGEVWCYRIEHPEGKIFIDQGSHFFEGAAEEVKGVDFMFAGVSNKASVSDFFEKYVGLFSPKILVPLHFDFFFSKANRGETKFLPGIELDQIRARIERDAPKTRFVLPGFGERVLLK